MKDNSKITEVTSVKTKSGTTIYADGGSRQERCKALDQFLKYYNQDFTISEQKTIGNVWYECLNHKGKNLHGETIAEAGAFTGSYAKTYNPHKKKIIGVTFAKDVRNNEGVIVHEMIHARMLMQGIPGSKHNERQIDFEMTGRLSKKGLKNSIYGYYYSDKGNKHLAKLKLTNVEKGKIAQQGLLDDHNLLTGSVNKSIKGRVAEKRAKKLFKQSFFNKKDFS